MLEPGAKSARNQQLREEQLAALRLKREPRDHSVACLGQEDEEGNVEYKLRIKDPHPVRLQQLVRAQVAGAGVGVRLAGGLRLRPAQRTLCFPQLFMIQSCLPARMRAISLLHKQDF